MSFTKEQIEDTVKDIIAEQMQIEASEIEASMSFVEDLETDSLDTVEMVMAFEEAFKIDIEDEQAKQISTVQSVIDSIAQNLEAKS